MQLDKLIQGSSAKFFILFQMNFDVRVHPIDSVFYAPKSSRSESLVNSEDTRAEELQLEGLYCGGSRRSSLGAKLLLWKYGLILSLYTACFVDSFQDTN